MKPSLILSGLIIVFAMGLVCNDVYAKQDTIQKKKSKTKPAKQSPSVQTKETTLVNKINANLQKLNAHLKDVPKRCFDENIRTQVQAIRKDIQSSLKELYPINQVKAKELQTKRSEILNNFYTSVRTKIQNVATALDADSMALQQDDAEIDALTVTATTTTTTAAPAESTVTTASPETLTTQS